MATHTKHCGKNGLPVAMKNPSEVNFKAECEEILDDECSPRDLCTSSSSAGKNTSGVTSFTTNHNSVVCLPLVSEGLKLVWTQSDQTRELDTVPALVQAFNLFPYPSSREVNALARACALPLDKVKVWFMVQRIKYGISWSSEEIEETRQKLAVPEVCDDSSETKEESRKDSKSNSSEVIENEDCDKAAGVLSSDVPQKMNTCESPEPAQSTATCFSSALPPPEDSYFYHPPAGTTPAKPPSTPTTQSTATDASLDLSELSSRPHRHRRYKKSKAQLAALRRSFLMENWPAEPELRRLQQETGLNRNDIRKWFSDSRYQLRVGRGSLAAIVGKHDQPLSLTTKSRQSNGVKVPEGARNNGIRNSHFFQTFLSNSLEAFGEKVLETKGQNVVEELSGDGDSSKDEEQSDEGSIPQTVTCKIEPDVPLESSNVSECSPYSSPSGSPPPHASPSKPPPIKIAISKKSAKTSPSTSASTSPAFTPGGRPRKTKEQLSVLKEYFLHCQWPKSEEYTNLVKLTGLPRADVIQWFGDTRYAVKNGQLRWVKGGLRDQFLAELAAQQSSSPSTNGGCSRKRKSQSNGRNTDSPDTQPLENYYLITGTLLEKDLDTLCKKSRMSYQQVRDWFAAQDGGEPDQELIIAE
ncbi:homeobox and leucine zipper encoding a [Pholidichthys leucotaenia]